jgi:integrase/recombinase XerD
MSEQNSIEDNGIIVYLKRFLDWGESINYSAMTIKKRNTSIRRFIVWCDDRGLQKPQDITASILEGYRQHLFHYRKRNGNPLGFNTQRSLLTPLKAFFKWLAKENHILYNPASEFDLPRVPKRLPKYILNTEEINDMLNHTALYGEMGVRDRAIIETFYSTGIRRMELANLKIHDIDLERGTVVIFEGKFKKDRVVPIGDRACAWVRKYMGEVRPKLIRDDEGYVFLTDYGEPFINNRATNLIKKYKEAVGIDKPGACHMFRNAMATHMLDNGADIRFIQEMLGHVNLSSTQIYTQVSIKKLKEIHTATHPAKLERQQDPREPLN